jgi:hypothetical protein
MIEHIRSSIDATSILQSTVAEVRQFLKTERVLIYRCQDWASQLDGEEQKGAIVAGDRKHPGYKPPDSFRKQTQDRGNKKRVSDETCLTYLSVGSMLQSKI